MYFLIDQSQNQRYNSRGYFILLKYKSEFNSMGRLEFGMIYLRGRRFNPHPHNLCTKKYNKFQSCFSV